MIDHTVRTRDGRALQVVEAGAAHGLPIFALNGTPMSRMLYPDHIQDATERGIRLISYDRPGYGESTPAPGRVVVDAAKDIGTIADSLGIDRFAIWGVSGGAPHALACAARLGSRVVAAASLAAPAPYPAEGLDWFAGQVEQSIEEYRAAIAGPAEMERYIRPIRAQMLTANPEDALKVFQSLVSPVDQGVLSEGLAAFFRRSGLEALRLSGAGWRDDDIAFLRPWGFSLSEVHVPVLLWHGRHDAFVPFIQGEWLARHLPNVEARLSDTDGHLTLFARRIPETQAWLRGHF